MITRAQQKHLPEIDRIYNQAIEDGFRTAHLQPLTAKERQVWLTHHTQNEYPVFVWIEKNEVWGWLSLSPYRSGRDALNSVAEISYYVDYAHQGKGIASQLMEKGIEFSRKQGFRILVAIMISGNKASVGLAHKFGFRESGRIEGAIQYDDEIRDHVYMSLNLL